jgi:hypothetical protein
MEKQMPNGPKTKKESKNKSDPWVQYKNSGCTCQVEDAAGFPTIVLYDLKCPYMDHAQLAEKPNNFEPEAKTEKEIIESVISKLREKHYEDFYPNPHLVMGLKEEETLIDAIILLLQHDYCLED